MIDRIEVYCKRLPGQPLDVMRENIWQEIEGLRSAIDLPVWDRPMLGTDRVYEAERWIANLLNGLPPYRTESRPEKLNPHVRRLASPAMLSAWKEIRELVPDAFEGERGALVELIDWAQFEFNADPSDFDLSVELGPDFYRAWNEAWIKRNIDDGRPEVREIRKDLLIRSGFWREPTALGMNQPNVLPRELFAANLGQMEVPNKDQGSEIKAREDADPSPPEYAPTLEYGSKELRQLLLKRQYASTPVQPMAPRSSGPNGSGPIVCPPTERQREFLIAINSLRAHAEGRAVKLSRILREGKIKGSPRSKHILDLIADLKQKSLICAKRGVGIWLTAEGVRLAASMCE